MTTANPPIAPVSVLRTLNLVTAQLDRVLSGLSAYSDADRALRQLAHELTAACALSADVVVASVLLNQIAGRYAVRHCVDTAVIACVVAQGMGRPPEEVLTIAAASLTMNVGMMRQIETFQNRPSALTPDEREIVRRHPSQSVALLREAGVTDEDWLVCVMHHHENDDGSGYPAVRPENAISANARLIGLADRYCACVSARNYRRSMLPPVTLDVLRRDAGNDPELTRHFLERMGRYPPGTLVKLANGDTGVVTGRDALFVHALRDAEGAPLSIVRNAEGRMHEICAALHEDEARLRFSMKTVWGQLATL
ncbi:metal-dependent phosphohydrolase [Massilia eurypsychrophila]|jgi:HD-GYP domain-containing protein (c-di-GMP phosphodiesterase class II)|uniref:Metal-dependent phosphohydrolase n=1 Tax=Massilia eurypsychrophila TaxID=1485217 RepID=A0A2G8TIS7_9BURK|nr:HD domain-containing phosphohydrolase [Massilia eurypsychrophila]PIL45947.1 metal-dependent phosphohydrolase [Massilia eurypsychrophila]